MTFDWNYMFGLLFDAEFWRATWTVIKLSFVTWVVSIALGFFVALAKQSKQPLLSAPARAYIWLFRSLPLLVLLIFVYNIPQAFPAASVVLSDPFWAGLLAMVLCETAYVAEIHRGGLLSIHKGQAEAARALGLKFLGTQWRVVIPQALRVALPSLANEYISIVKLSSLVSVISLTEILMVGQRLYSQNFLVMETMAAVAFYYVLIVTVFDFLLKRLEKFLDVNQRNVSRVPDAEVLALATQRTVVAQRAVNAAPGTPALQPADPAG
jgi:polar amino acid transport system permease protein